MKYKILLISIVFLMVYAKNSAQTIEFGTSYSEGNVEFYKHVPSAFLGFNYNFKRQTIFLDFSTSYTNTSYNNIEWSPIDNTWWIASAKEKRHSNSLKLGLSQVLVNTENSRISIGGFGSITNFSFRVDWINLIVFDNHYIHTFGKFNDTKKNRIGYGGFIDFEIKHVIFKSTSVFFRIGGEDLHYQEEVYGGGPDYFTNFQFLSGLVGFRVNLKKENS